MAHVIKDWEKWGSAGTEMVKCPVEGCGHVGSIVTKVHCRLEHGMEREEVKEKYGFPKRIIKRTIKGDVGQ